MVHALLEDRHLLTVAEGNGDHAIGICSVVSLLRLNVLGCRGRAADVICDPICWSSVQIDLCETAVEDIHENACPIVGVNISFEIALGKKITVSLYKVDLMNQALGNEFCPTSACLLVGIAPSI